MDSHIKNLNLNLEMIKWVQQEKNSATDQWLQEGDFTRKKEQELAQFHKRPYQMDCSINNWRNDCTYIRFSVLNTYRFGIRSRCNILSSNQIKRISKKV